MNQNLRFSGRLRGFLYLAALGLPTLLMAVVLLQPFYEPKWMFLDSLTAAELSGDCCHSYYGAVSNLGIILWIATASAMLMGGFVLLATKTHQPLAMFGLIGGAFSLWLGLDDMFLLHELVLPTLGLPQVLVMAIYIAFAIGYFAVSWRVILQAEFWILGFGAAALAVSVAVDTVMHSLLPVLVYLEDSAKFIGIFCWFAFHFLTIGKALLVANQLQLKASK